MALIKLNINTFKKDLGGIANRLVDKVVNKVENKLENAVEDAFAKGLKKVGLSDGIARQISSRFSDAVSVGRADKFFQSSTAEQDRVTPKEIETRTLNLKGAETTFDAVQKINSQDIKKTDVLQFPDQLGKYYIELDFQSYHRPSPQMEAIFKRFRTILLPIPRDLKETFDLNVDGKAQGAAGGVVDLGVDLLRGAGDKVSGTEFAIAYSFMSQALEGGYGDILGQALGAVPNPHLQAIFSGVDLRTHTFQWTFAPRNPTESKTLKNIINEIKKNSLPAYSTTGTAALQYPPMVNIRLMPWAKTNDNLIIFKKCLVKSVSVNYAPAGLPSFFQGTDLPTMIQLELSFLETEIQTARDYGLQSGEREDGLEQFKDAIESGSEKIGKALGVDVKGTLNETKQLTKTFYNSVSSGSIQAGRPKE
jgi:hypothetical protein